MSDPLRPHESQHARPPCPTPTGLVKIWLPHFSLCVFHSVGLEWDVYYGFPVKKNQQFTNMDKCIYIYTYIYIYIERERERETETETETERQRERESNSFGKSKPWHLPCDIVAMSQTAGGRWKWTGQILEPNTGTWIQTLHSSSEWFHQHLGITVFLTEWVSGSLHSSLAASGHFSQGEFLPSHGLANLPK